MKGGRIFTVAVAALAMLAGVGCAGRESETTSRARHEYWTPQASGSRASLRGLHAVSERVAWASGSDGAFLRTTDGGRTWRVGSVPGAAELDFRDVYAFDAETALLLSAGRPARVYRTSDGGANWTETYTNNADTVFFDALAFWDADNGIAFSDPVDGAFMIITTTDGGRSWTRVDPAVLPPPLAGEAGFAASGTCLAVHGDGHVWIGTGGGPVARVLRSADRGRSWHVAETPLIGGLPSTGIFSLAFRDELHGVAVGGDYQNPDQTARVAAVTSDGGATWTLVNDAPPSGYRSCVAYIPGAATPTLIAVGPNGTDRSADDGRSWARISDVGYHAVSFARDGSGGWASGADGRIARYAPPRAADGEAKR